MGNPAGIVLDCLDLNTDRMQEIAKRISFNETVFLLPSTVADVKLRYFTPGHEIDLCGHGTVAALVAACENEIVRHVNTIETRAGILHVELDSYGDNTKVVMEQNPAQFIKFNGNKQRLAQSLNLNSDDLDFQLPIVYGNTGIWTLLVPVKRLDFFKRMVPYNKSFPDVLTQNSRSSIHPFCLETYNNIDMHGRHFSSPYSGTIEDVATGTASGVMGAYYLKYIERTKRAAIKIEQGQELGKDSIIDVDVDVQCSNEKYFVKNKGTATFVKEMIL